MWEVLQRQTLKFCNLQNNLASSRIPRERKNINFFKETKNFARNSSTRGTHFASGAVFPKPCGKKRGVLKVLTLVLPFMMVGGMLSSTAAEMLHEYDIFSPED